MKSMSMVEGEVQDAIDTFDQLINLLTSKQLTVPLELKNSTNPSVSSGNELYYTTWECKTPQVTDVSVLSKLHDEQPL